MHIGLVVISNRIGGTERRFARLFSYLSRCSQHKYTLVLPTGLFDQLCDQDILNKNKKNVIQLFDRFPYSLYNIVGSLRVLGYRVPGLTTLLTPLWRLEMEPKRVKNVLEEFDVVHFALPFNPVLSLPRQPTVIEAQDSNFHHVNSRLVQEGVRGHAIFNCASERIRSGYMQRFADQEIGERLHTSPCSFIDYNHTSIAVKEPLITFVGRMEKIKNPTLFVSAIELLAQKRQDFKAVLVGTGKMDSYLDQIIKKKNLHLLMSRQFYSRPEEILSRSLVFVSLQTYDNYHSQALMEAMACGCAVVASDCGETWRLVSDDVGFRVPLDAEVIAERISYLLDNYNEALQMGQSARQKVMREQTIEIYTDYLEDLYEKAVSVFRR